MATRCGGRAHVDAGPLAGVECEEVGPSTCFLIIGYCTGFVADKQIGHTIAIHITQIRRGMIAHINALNGTAVGKTVAQKASSVLVIVDHAVFCTYDHIWIEVGVEVGEGGAELFA